MSGETSGSAASSCVVVHWNQSVRVRETLDRLRSGVDLIVIVDNGSDPDHLERLRQIVEVFERQGGAQLVLLEAGENLGFGPGANLGLRWVLAHQQGGITAVCPHDAHVAHDTMALARDLLDSDPTIGLACADVGDGMTPVMDPYFGGMIVGSTETSADRVRVELVDYPHGTLMFARLSCLADVGVFDERYFAYCEEADLGARARAAGWGVALLRGVRVTNSSVSTSSALVDYLQHRNTLLLVREHSGRYHAAIRWLIAAGQLVQGLVAPERSTQFTFHARARCRALLDAPRGRFGPPPTDLVDDARRAERDRWGDTLGPRRSRDTC